jgi:hypothetical protein
MVKARFFQSNRKWIAINEHQKRKFRRSNVRTVEKLKQNFRIIFEYESGYYDKYIRNI